MNSKKARKKARKEAQERAEKTVGKVYFHIGNGGVALSVQEEEGGPVLDIRAEHFGIQTNHMKLDITVEGLIQLGGMLQRASEHEFRPLDEHWTYARVHPED